MPSVRILDNVQLEANCYVIKIKEVEAGNGRIWPGQYMVMDPTGAQVDAARHPHHRADLRPARHLGRRRAQGRRRDQGLHRGRRRHRAVDPPHRADQGQRLGADLLCGGQQADQGPAEGTGRPGQGHRAGADLRVRHPARAAAPAGGAGVDPRPADHPRRHRRRASRSRATRRRWSSTCGRGSRASSARNTPRRPATCRSSR